MKTTSGTEAKQESRSYIDAGTEVRVALTEAPSVEDVSALVADYTYDGKPVPAAWPKPEHGRSDNRTTEMVIACKAFGRLGFQGVRLSPKDPPFPDIFVEGPAMGAIAVEVTFARDPGEAAFQTSRGEFETTLNEMASGKGLVFHHNVDLSVVAVPRDKDRTYIAQMVIDQIRENLGTLGAHSFEGPVVPFVPRYEINKRSGTQDRPPLVCAGLVNARGHADLFAVVLEWIGYKRKYMRYPTDGRPLWLIVGLTIPFFAPPVMLNLFETDLELGQFDRVIISDESEVLTFERQRA